MGKPTTLLLDERSIKEGKILAALKGISLSALMRQMIHEQFKEFEKDQDSLRT